MKWPGQPQGSKHKCIRNNQKYQGGARRVFLGLQYCRLKLAERKGRGPENDRPIINQMQRLTGAESNGDDYQQRRKWYGTKCKRECAVIQAPGLGAARHPKVHRIICCQTVSAEVPRGGTDKENRIQ